MQKKKREEHIHVYWKFAILFVPVSPNIHVLVKQFPLVLLLLHPDLLSDESLSKGSRP